MFKTTNIFAPNISYFYKPLILKEMKFLKIIKLNQISKKELEKKTMKVLKGGRCGCEDGCKPNSSVSFGAVSDSWIYSGY